MTEAKWIGSMLAVAASAVGLATAAVAQEDWAAVEAAAKEEGTLVFYNAQQGWTQPIAAAEGFEAKYGIRVDMLHGLRGAEMMERIRVETSNNQDSGDIVMMGVTGIVPMAQQGSLQDHGGVPNIANLALEPWTPEDVPVYSVTYGIAVNTDMVSEEDMPKSWLDLADPKWKGKILSDEMTVPSGGQSWFAVTLEAFGEDYHRAMAEQDLQYSRATAERALRVARGEFAFAIPFNLAELESLEGLPVTGIIPEEGSPYTPISVAMIKGARHPNAAKLFINYLLSEEGQLHFAQDGLSISTQGMEELVPEELRWRVFGKLLGHADIEKQPDRLIQAGEIYDRK
jgi:iron(III) transport system substrate-binding protein